MQKQLTFTYQEFSHTSELQSADRDLLSMAAEALKSSYSPYSNFRVGAAVLLEDGSIFTGSNQENMAFPDSLCAERVACFAAAAAKPGIPIRCLAITARAQNFLVSNAITPCGSCRQVLMEYEKLYQKPIRLIMSGETGSIIITGSIEQLLPMSFDGEDLKKST